MSNQTIKNMDLVLLEIRKEIFNNYGDSKAVKTLINSYQNLLHSLTTLSNEEFNELNILKSLDIHANTINYLIDEIESDTIHKAMNIKDYVAVNNYTIILSKMKQSVETIKPHKSNTRSIGYVDSIIDELLELSIKSGTLITFKDEVHRGMGKTTALIKKAHELGCVLICGNDSQAKYANMQATELGINVVALTPRSAMSLIQFTKILESNGFLVDELVNQEHIYSMTQKGYKLHGGFTRIVL